MLSRHFKNAAVISAVNSPYNRMLVFPMVTLRVASEVVAVVLLNGVQRPSTPVDHKSK